MCNVRYCYGIRLLLYIHISVPGTKKGLKRDNEVQSLCNNKGVPTWMPADSQMNHGGSNVHAQWFSCQKIGADDHDIMM